MSSNAKGRLEKLLLAWERGALREQDVHSSAEELLEELGWPEFEPQDPRSIPIEVLRHLEIMDHQLITQQDIPAILSFLRTPIGCEGEGWREWESYWDQIDYTERAESVADNPYYSARRLEK